MATISELREKFSGLPLSQKKQFIENLRSQLQNTTKLANKQFLNECIRKYNEEKKYALENPDIQQAEPPSRDSEKGKGISTARSRKKEQNAATVQSTRIGQAPAGANAYGYYAWETAPQSAKSRKTYLPVIIIVAIIAVSAAVVFLITNRGAGKQNIDSKDLINLMGATTQEVVRAFGEPLPSSVENVSLFYYRRDSNNSSLMFFFGVDNRVNTITLFPGGADDITVCGTGITDSIEQLEEALALFEARVSYMRAPNRVGEIWDEYYFPYRGANYTLTAIYNATTGERTAFMLAY